MASIPNSFQIGSQVLELLDGSGRLVRCWAGPFLEPFFQLTYAFQCLIPTTFQLVGHQAILRVNGVKLFPRALGLIACGFEITFERLTNFIPLMHGFLTCQHGCLHGSGLHNTKDLPAKGFIDWDATKGDALRLSLVQLATHAAIAQEAMRVAGVVNDELAAAAATAQQAAQ